MRWANSWDYERVVPRQLSLNTANPTRLGISGDGADIFGGEQKRLSLGCDLISTLKLIFCDELTSGVDAFRAVRVMQSLKSLADAGHIVIIRFINRGRISLKLMMILLSYVQYLFFTLVLVKEH